MTTPNDISTLHGITQPLKGTGVQQRNIWLPPGKRRISSHHRSRYDERSHNEVDFTPIDSARLSHLAVATALSEKKELNAHYSDEGVTTFEDVNIGIAVATDAGLTVSVIHGCREYVEVCLADLSGQM